MKLGYMSGIVQLDLLSYRVQHMHTCSECVYIAYGISTGYCGIRVGGPKLDKQNTQARVCIPTPECFQVLQGVHANSGGYTGGYEPIPEHVLVVLWRCHVEISLEYVQLLWSMHTFSEECIHTLEYLYLHTPECLYRLYTNCNHSSKWRELYTHAAE